MNSSSTPRNCFVGMFDIIGFKDLRAQRGTAGLHQLYQRGILPGIAHSAAGKGKTEKHGDRTLYVPDFADCVINYRAISDTVIFFTPDDSFNSFFFIVQSSFMLLQFGFSGIQAPYRGAIGWGDLIDDPQGILIGSAIEDAYVGEGRQVWSGAMLTETCREFADERGYLGKLAEVSELAQKVAGDELQKRRARENGGWLVKYAAPVQQNPKNGPVIYSTIETYVVNWTIRMFEGASNKAFRPSENDHERSIAENTLAFEKWARSQK